MISMSTLAPSSEYEISPCCSFCLPLQKPPFAPAFWKSQFDAVSTLMQVTQINMTNPSQNGLIIRARRVTWSQFWDKKILLMSFEKGFTLITDTKNKRLFSFTEHYLYNDTWNHRRGFLITSIIHTHTPPQIAENDSLGKIGENHDTCYFWTLSQPIPEPLKCLLHPTELGLFLLSAVCMSTDTDLFISSCVAKE